MPMQIKEAMEQDGNIILKEETKIVIETLTAARRESWLNALGRSVDDPMSVHNVICSLHFSPDDFLPNQALRKNAIPSLQLRPGKISSLVSCRSRLEVRYEDSRPLQSTSVGQSEAGPSNTSDMSALPLIEECIDISEETADTVSLVSMTSTDDSDVSAPKGKRKASAIQTSSSDSVGLLGSTKKKRRLLRLDHAYYWSPRKMKIALSANKDAQSALRSKLKTSKQKIKRLSERVKSLKQVVQHLRNKNLINDEAHAIINRSCSGVPLALMSRLFDNSRRGKIARKSFPPELRSFAMTLNFYSTKAYEYVRSTFKLALPSLSTIRSWMTNIECLPGFSQTSFELLKNQVVENKGHNKQTVCSLMLDEMSIKKQVDFVGGKAWGYVDMSTGIEDDSLECATEALVIMVVGVNGHWKLPIGYFFIKSLTGAAKANIIRQALVKLSEIDVTILSITSDGPTANFAMMEALGAKVAKISELNTYFDHPVNNAPVYIILDACHMVKLLRNCWATLGTIIDYEGREIKWNLVRKLFELQEAEGLRFANKLSKAHIEWQRQKMKVKLATQTFSNSVAEAMEFLKNIGHADFQTADGTIRFLRTINNLFDLLNSRNPFGKGCHTPLRASNKNYWHLILLNSIEYLTNLKTVDQKFLYTTPKKTTIRGFVITIKSLLAMYETYVDSDNALLSYLLTYMFSQDHLELFFCSIRTIVNGLSLDVSSDVIKVESDLSDAATEGVGIVEQSNDVPNNVIKEELDLMDTEDDGDDDTEEGGNALHQEIQMETDISETKTRRRFGIRKCTICQQLFKTLVDLRKHIFTHSNERPFACIPCKMRFMKRSHLQQHIKLKHKVLERKTNKQGESNLKHNWNLLRMQCKLCKKILLKKNYKRHIMLTHDRLQIYLCSICNHKCREQAKFLEHMQLLHQDIPPLTELKEDLPFSCKKCEQSFAYKICFDKHKCIHRGIQKYKCSFCEYKCTTKDSVKEHAKNKHDADVDFEEILEDFTVNLDEIKARLKLNKNKKPHKISKENIVPQRNSIFLKEEGASVEGDDMQYKINQKGINDIKAEIMAIKDEEKEEEDINSVDGGKYDKPNAQIKSCVEVDEQKIYSAEVPETGNSMTTNYKEDKHYKVVLDEGGARAFQCTLCNRILKKRYLAERHVLRHTGDHPLSCSFCRFRTGLKDTMHQHLKTEHDVDVNLMKEKDSSEVTTNSTEETHYKIVLDGEVKVYKCNFCDRTTKEKYLVERHILTHTGEFPLSCSLCSIKTRQKKSMRLHLKKEHGLTVTFKQIAKDGTLTLDLDPQDENTCRIAIKNGLKVYQCNACNKVFSRKDNLDKHYTVHTGLYSFHCTKCKYKTNEKGNMQKHVIRKHKIEADSEDLHKHMATRPKQCDDSSLTDLEESNAEELRMQGITDPIRANGGQDKYQSPLPQGAARYTVIIENDARSFKCNVCGEISTEKCLFNAHFLAHTEKLPYSCTICGHKARSKKTIKNHMRRRHKINVKVQDIPEEIVNSDTSEDDEGEEEEEHNSIPEMECKYIEIEEENAKFLKCLLCDKKLKTLKKMKLHFLIHQGKFVYMCSMCKYKTVEKDNMQKHMKVKHKMDVSVADILSDNEVRKKGNEDLVNDKPQHSEVIYVKEDMDVDYESDL